MPTQHQGPLLHNPGPTSHRIFQRHLGPIHCRKYPEAGDGATKSCSNGVLQLPDN